jgi:hypothetical protein
VCDQEHACCQPKAHGQGLPGHERGGTGWMDVAGYSLDSMSLRLDSERRFK